MTRFEPFAGIRYASATALDLVTCPPYDVISDAERVELQQRSSQNAVRVELPADETGRDRYEAARDTFEGWLAGGILREDEGDGFYAYRMTFADDARRPRRTLGVIGALGVEPPGGDVLPHERTMPKPKGDRLNLLRSCRANLSPIWGLTPKQGLAAICDPTLPADAICRDEAGVTHELWRIIDRDALTAIRAHVAADVVIIADGHHRYETASAYQAERRAAGAGAGAHDFVMALIVELADDQLSVGAIHRLLRGLPPDFDFETALDPFFEMAPTAPVDAATPARMLTEGSIVLVTQERTLALRPRPATLDKAEHELDSSILDVALTAFPEHELVYQHGWDNVVAAVKAGDAQAGALLRPARVDQIAATGRTGVRMPPKTTFFYPKPRTGLVFRRL